MCRLGNDPLNKDTAVLTTVTFQVTLCTMACALCHREQKQPPHPLLRPRGVTVKVTDLRSQYGVWVSPVPVPMVWLPVCALGGSSCTVAGS
jgi:hypothetical protein